MTISDEELRQAFVEIALRDEPLPTDAEIAALVDGEGDEASRLATLARLTATPEGRRELAMIWALHAGIMQEDEPVTDAPAPSATVEITFPTPAQRRWPQRLRPAGLAAAALIVSLIGVQRFTARSSDSVYRSSAPGLALVVPTDAAVTSGVTRFAWRAIAGASYEVAVYAADGREILRQATGDTTITLTVPAAAGDYRWWVTALLEDGTQLRSATRRISMR